jgi:hypothetical protein
MSYNGVAQVGVNVDTLAVPNPAELVDDLRAGLEEIIALGAPPETSRPAPDAAEVATATKAPAKQATANKAPAKKAPAKKTPAKKTPAKKTPAT